MTFLVKPLTLSKQLGGMHMKRKELDFVLQQNRYLEGGTKEACVKVREFLSHATNPGNQIHSSLSCVTADEFMDAFGLTSLDELPDLADIVEIDEQEDIFATRYRETDVEEIGKKESDDSETN